MIENISGILGKDQKANENYTGENLVIKVFVYYCTLAYQAQKFDSILLVYYGQVNIDINFLFLVVGLMVSSSVPPLTFLLVWPAVPKGAAISGALGGQVCAIIAWIVHAKVKITNN